MRLFVGLGNPGARYEETRHNIGFRLIDVLVERYEAVDISKKSFHGQLFKRNDTLFLKPLTYMNLSGKSVAAVKTFYKLSAEDIAVIHDDIDLPFGALRLKRGGGHGGHNGLKSIDAAIGREYLRVRMGVGKPTDGRDTADYVLSAFTPQEEACIAPWIAYAADLCEKLFEIPLEELKSRYTLKGIDGVCR